MAEVVHGVQPDEIDLVWNKASQILKRAVDKSLGEMQVEDIKDRLEDQSMQLWLVEGACAVTEVINYERYKACRIVYLAGDDMDTWFDSLVNRISDWANYNGCKRVEAYGRRGWVRQAKHLDFKEAYTVIYREVANGRR